MQCLKLAVQSDIGGVKTVEEAQTIVAIAEKFIAFVDESVEADDDEGPVS